MSSAPANLNIEKIGSIRVVSSTSVANSRNPEEQKGELFGGYGYSADVQANNGQGYSISIRVISANGKYNISSSDLSVRKDGAKNITIGKFTFFDFYLTSYSIDKQVDDSILTLTYKDKSIFMDKVFIGLFGHHYGFDVDPKKQPENTLVEQVDAFFDYKCSDTLTKQASLSRYLKRVKTTKASDAIFKLYAFPPGTILPGFLNSDAFHCKYTYSQKGIDGGYIILGREEINEEVCDLPEVSYCFKDLTSSLAYAGIPGVVEFNLPNKNNTLFSILRRKYFGSLRSVLDQWGGDFAFKFYFQPKVRYYTKNYDSNDSAEKEVIINEGLKLINLTSTESTLKNLNDLLNTNKGVQKIISNESESATLEGTKASALITSIRTEARSFDSSSSIVIAKNAKVLGLNILPPFYENAASIDSTIIGGTLSIYDPALRDVYHLSNGNLRAMGISQSFPILSSAQIVAKLDFLLLFGPGLGDNPSAVLDDYVVSLAIYDESKHNLIKEWEKSIMTEYYGQFYMTSSNVASGYTCTQETYRSTEVSTTPDSESYAANELPFAKLLFGKFNNDGGKQDDRFPETFGSRRYNPIFQANNPFDSANEKNYKTFSESIPNYESSKAIKIINLKEDPRASMALYSCFVNAGASGTNTVFDQLNEVIQNNNASLIICKKFKPSGSYVVATGETAISSIAISSTLFPNDSVKQLATSRNDEVSADSLKRCTTTCDETLATVVCGDDDENKIDSSEIGFSSYSGRKITITSRPIGVGGVVKTCDFILPVTSEYRYVESSNNNNTDSIPASTYVLGSPPETGGNVMSHEVVENTVPEMLTQSVRSDGIVDKVISFDPETGVNNLVQTALDYHKSIERQLNNSVPKPFQQKKISLTSVCVPDVLQNYLFNAQILNSINFSFNESGFNIALDFSSRPKIPVQKDVLFSTERFLRTL